LELLETAFQMLRTQPLSTAAPHLIGSAPFLAGLLAFLFEMSSGLFAVERLLHWSFGLTLLWVWMNFWQAVYCRRLLLKLAHEPAIRWNPSGILRSAMLQTAIQGFKPVLFPAAFLFVLPFAWMVAFFQSITTYASAPDASLSNVWARSREAASAWQKQSWMLLCLLALMAIVVFINIAVGTFVTAQLARSFLGITSLVFGTPSAFLNTTMMGFVAAATYACVDPVAKAAYVVRSFAFESIRTGADIHVALKRIAQTAAMALILCVGPASAQQAVNAGELDRAVDRVLRQPEYSWRMPRETPRASNSMLDRAADAIAAGFKKAIAAVERAVEWLLDLFIDREIEIPGGGVRASSGRRVRIAMLAVSALLAVVLLIVGWRLRRKTPAIQITAKPVTAAAVNLTDDNVAASQLDEDEWLRLSEELLANGEPRLALRAVFLSALSRLQRDGLITLERFKTNLDYDRELARRARAFPQVHPAFRRLLQIFEPRWYGNIAADATIVNEMQSLLIELKAHA
jgi:hypothetical protein